MASIQQQIETAEQVLNEVSHVLTLLGEEAMDDEEAIPYATSAIEIVDEADHDYTVIRSDLEELEALLVESRFDEAKEHAEMIHELLGDSIALAKLAQ